MSVALAPVKKLIRTLVFVLAFKDCVDAASRWLHRGYLVAVALENGHLDEEALARTDGVWPVTLAIEESIMKIDTSPINQLVWQAFEACWIRYFGPPELLISDGGPEFFEHFERALEHHGTFHHFSDANSPWQNGPLFWPRQHEDACSPAKDEDEDEKSLRNTREETLRPTKRQK